ncbi:MAG TPA: hypothetical protein VK826_00355 [Bacteroidia bacterium]|nr:hypothetical protein [Bacteroidia bacterium]
MSFFSRLFTRKITYVDTFCRDKSYSDILHVFGAIRIMPDEGDSFDIWRHAVIDVNTFEVINGLQQRGNEFSVKSPFAERCLKHMSEKMNRQLELDLKEKKEEDDEAAWSDDYVPEPDGPDFEDGCEIMITDRDSSDSDTAEPKKLPKNGLVFTKNNIGDRERFTVELYKGGRSVVSHQMQGLPDYFRKALLLRAPSRLYVTYRKEGYWGMSGGMALFVLDMNTGEMIHDGYIR